MKPLVGIFSKPSSLAVELCQNLLKRDCRVYVIGEKKEWKQNLKYLNSEDLEIISEEASPGLDYCFFLGGFLGENFFDFKDQIKKAKIFLERNNTKSLFVFPYKKKEVVSRELSDTPYKFLFLGELFGPHMEFIDGEVLSETFYQIAESDKVYLPPVDFDLPYLYIPDAVEEVVRSLFSYSFSVHERVVAQKTSFYRFLGEIGKANPEIIFIPGTKKIETFDNSSIKFSEPRKSSQNAIIETLSWIAGNRLFIVGERHARKKVVAETPRPVKTESVKKSAIKPFKFGRGSLIVSIVSFLLILCLPYLTLLLSFVLLKFSLESYVSGKQNLGRFLMAGADYSSKVGFISANTLSNIPYAGRAYIFAVDGSIFVREAIVVGNRAVKSIDLLKNLVSGMLSEESYDLNEISHELAANTELVYQDLSFLQSEIDKIPAFSVEIAKRGVNINSYRKLFLYGSDVAKNLPELLGMAKPKTYLILFQNNMELRPTGGFIGSFALATFDKGKLSNVEFFDVYTADGQLKGHVEPPSAIKDHLGEANWYLRDSNWDPDFSISSQRAEWFLDKELERSVDGVVGIDVEVLRDLLWVLGPIRITDAGLEVDYKNVYEKVQYEVENNFFPGSQKKTNLLTSLGKEILAELKETKNINYEGLGKVVIKNLNSRHIQMFFHNADVQKAITSLNFGGEVTTPSCQIKNCASMLIGIVDANVGVNKVNYFISRSIAVNSFISKDKIENTIVVEYKNDAPAALGISGRYKNYVRLITNANVQVKSVGIADPGGIRAVTADVVKTRGRSEIGVLVDIPAGSKKSVRYSITTPTSLNFDTPGKVEYLIRKQAGTGDDLIVVKVVAPDGVAFGGSNVYNTHLVGDITIEPTW